MKLTAPMQRLLRKLAAGEAPYDDVDGRAAKAGVTSTIWALTERGLLRSTREGHELTDLGREVALELAGETIREFDARLESMSLEEKKAALRRRREAAEPMLRELLTPGVRFRATKAECGAKEATFVFAFWDGGWIVSTGTASICPSQVYSVGDRIIRV